LVKTLIHLNGLDGDVNLMSPMMVWTF